jgi:hypothetical protein
MYYHLVFRNKKKTKTQVIIVKTDTLEEALDRLTRLKMVTYFISGIKDMKTQEIKVYISKEKELKGQSAEYTWRDELGDFDFSFWEGFGSMGLTWSS